MKGQQAEAHEIFSRMSAQLRQATTADIPEIQRVRHSVKENRLTSRVILDDEVAASIEGLGRGWVAEVNGRIVGFSIANCTAGADQTGSIWALFVEPAFEGQGHGRRLHDAAVDWLWSCGRERLWLSTEADTRAERFYELSGWQRCGLTPDGEVRFEMLTFQPRVSN